MMDVVNNTSNFGETDKDDLLRSLSACDFAIFDIALYLNTHPKDANAFAKFKSLCKKSEELTAHFESKFGALTIKGAANKPSWDWTNTPFPWEKTKA